MRWNDNNYYNNDANDDTLTMMPASTVWMPIMMITMTKMMSTTLMMMIIKVKTKFQIQRESSTSSRPCALWGPNDPQWYFWPIILLTRVNISKNHQYISTIFTTMTTLLVHKEDIYQICYHVFTNVTNTQIQTQHLFRCKRRTNTSSVTALP